ncbi:polymorphic toxin-type HINT domain-containing protein [Fontibacillus panacisegetis]|uniref:polymorphic toxin-type HINT domain-containing protein n=1 Tax=Fontibacillus panacisegetis TaxID=670482 RepID=UPI001FDF045F|nr:polymorphic toxin-type HINT domain-containing protein [Fontibacillus panacisegetis]
MSHKRNGTGLRSYSYSYDMNRNITGISENGATAKQFTYDPMNRITTSSQFNETYSYDSRGNRQTLKTESAHLMGKTVSYQYDEWDRLTKVNLANGASVEYKYNGDNLLVERKEGTVITRYYYDGQVIIAEGTVKADGSTDLKTSYLYGHSLMMSEDASDNKGYYLSNGHGDVVEICDSAGNILNQYTYDIWGNTLTASENVHNLFRYSGEYWDKSTNLQYLRARWYDPSIGRFIGEDTYEGQINNPLSLNLYTYVSNNPLKYVDPSGYRQEWGAGGGGSQKVTFWENEWNALKTAHSSWYNGIDFYTGGTLTALNNYYRVSQENPWSIEHFLSAGFIVVEVFPQGKSSKTVASLTDDGIAFIQKLLMKECNCFTSGTEVLTDEGEKNIEDIEVGDMVLAKNEETGEQAYKEVTALHRNEKDTTYKLSVGNQIIETTDNHPFWVDGKGWALAIDLKVGDELVQSNGNHLTIDNIEIVHHDEKVKVYNFTVADFHTYFVSSLGIWVHNIECLPTASFTTKKLQHEWKHAGDFGLSGNWNKTNGELYEKAIQNHMQGATNVWKSKYRGDDVFVYFDKNTGIGSYTDLSGNYVGGWKFNQAQLEFHQNNGQALFTK